MITNEHLANLNLGPKQILKLVPPKPETLIFEDKKLTKISEETEVQGYNQQQRKVQ